ncbi:hypothetical protein HanPSC8_Chr16g0711331 [Helianthus annuus]|nr:hypothetical protein HanPSC8_Chr16g0711331 [Helianthus annuus]
MTRAKISEINACNDTDLLDARPMKILFSYVMIEIIMNTAIFWLINMYT